MVWVASTCATSVAPMPKASAPSAPWVEVWLSPQVTAARQGQPLLRADHMDDALLAGR
jgi:hypothetical protein